MTVSIQFLSEANIPEMIQLWISAGLSIQRQGREHPESLRKQLNDDHLFFLGAFTDNKIVGVVIGSHDGRKGWINRLAVLPEFRGEGIARRLIHQCEKEFLCRDIGISTILIEPGNRDSMELFRLEGYEQVVDMAYLRKFLIENT